MVSFFQYDKQKVGFYYACLRQIYIISDSPKKNQKIRQAFKRQLRLATSQFDLVWDQYKNWQTDLRQYENNKDLYRLAKSVWSRQTQVFQHEGKSETNVRKTIFNFQNANKAKIDELEYLFWLQKLPSQLDKIWHLRRMVINFKQMMKPYLLKIQKYFQSDEERVIKTYKSVIKISQDKPQIQQKYLNYLTRRINKHIFGSVNEEAYHNTWGQKVLFYRSQIEAIINKKRNISEVQKQQITNIFMRQWIQVEQHITKSKQTVCQLYESLINSTNDFTLFEQYAYSLLRLGAPKDARNVLKRYVTHANDLLSKSTYFQFIGKFGTTEDEVQFCSYLREQATKQTQTKEQTRKLNIQQEYTPMQVQNPPPSQVQQAQMVDETSQKIYDKMNKNLHTDFGNTLFVKGFAPILKQTDILSVLKQPTKVTRINLIKKNNQAKNYCYVEMDSVQSAQYQVANNTSSYKILISKPPEQYDQNNTLFVCALPQDTTQEEVKSIFGSCSQGVKQVRLKMSNNKNFAYVEFLDAQLKQNAFAFVSQKLPCIKTKKVIVQRCDSNKTKTKQFLPVVFIKDLDFKTTQDQLINYFAGKEIIKILIPKNQKGKPKGFAYVEFKKFSQFQSVLDMKKGNIHNREFTILRSDRQITVQTHFEKEKQGKNNNKHEGKDDSKNYKKYEKIKIKQQVRQKKGNKKPEKMEEQKNNKFFSDLFK